MPARSLDEADEDDRPVKITKTCSLPAIPVTTIAEADQKLAAGLICPVALLEACLARVGATDSHLNSFVALERRATLMQAAQESRERSRCGARLGPLDGVVLALKDVIDTRGLKTSAGAAVYKDRVPDVDAVVVKKLRAAGAIIVGKTFTTEFATFGICNPSYREVQTRCPWNLSRQPGCSSAGNGSAVAAGQVIAALGHDSGGSLRIPAAFCGITAMKATHGLVSKRGCLCVSDTMDNVGPMARTALDCALLLNVIAGFDEEDPCSIRPPPGKELVDFTSGIEEDVRGLKLAVIPSLLHDCDPDVISNFRRSIRELEGLGIEVSEVEPMGSEDENSWRRRLTCDGVEVTRVEKAAALGSLLDQEDGMSPFSREEALAARKVSAAAYLNYQKNRSDVEARFEAALSENGLSGFLLPTMKFTAPPIVYEPDPRQDPFRTQFNGRMPLTRIFNHTRQPSIAAPNGFDAQGLPTSLMVTCGKWQDCLALRVVHKYQQATAYHLEQPPYPYPT